MPVYRVEIRDYIEVTLEEIWRAWRTDVETRVYEVEAEDEDEAREIAEAHGDLIEEDYEYGSIDDSEFYETGDEIDSEYNDRDIDVEEVETKEKPKLPEPDWTI